ncbi:MAG: YHS domain-containing protein [Planctomycetia bacterium]|nr:YHS domain-containing protein [Planctomycetia bacterium]
MNKQIFLAMVLLSGLGWACGAEISEEPSPFSSQEEMAKESHFFLFTDISQAMELAAELKCPILLHFYSPSCRPCQMMEKQVFASQEVQKTTQKYYLSVKVDGWKKPAMAEKFHVKGYPSDYILTHDGKVISRLMGFHSAETYRRFLEETASRMQFPPLSPEQTEQILAKVVPSIPFQPIAIRREVSPIPETESALAEREFLPGFAVSEEDSPQKEPEVLFAEKKSLMLEGFCPVTLVEEERWKKGDEQWGVWHEDGLYFFASEEAMEKFYRMPENYAVIAHGMDIVPLVDTQQVVPGSRKYGVRYDGKNFLFASEENRAKFREQPEEYLSQAQKVWIQTARQSQTTSR